MSSVAVVMRAHSQALDFDEPSDLKRRVDAGSSFSTLRTTSAAMMDKIHQKLEMLTSIGAGFFLFFF